MTRIGGSTRVVGIIGEPVAHSRSPAIHNAAFDACGLDWVYVAFPVAPGHGAAAVGALRTLGLAGLNVTMPHKADAARACDALTPTAAALRAVNTVFRPTGSGSEVWGDSTDGAGLVDWLRAEGIDPGGRSVVVVGAGGAARAVALALGEAGATVTVAARRAEAAAEAAALAAGRGVGLADLDDEVGAAALVVNATPLGMRGEPPPFDPARLRSDAIVVDTVYHPPITPLVEAARARGVWAANGLGLLVHQAALAFERWTGVTAPLDVMWDAARAEERG